MTASDLSQRYHDFAQYQLDFLYYTMEQASFNERKIAEPSTDCQLSEKVFCITQPENTASYTNLFDAAIAGQRITASVNRLFDAAPTIHYVPTSCDSSFDTSTASRLITVTNTTTIEPFSRPPATIAVTKSSEELFKGYIRLVTQQSDFLSRVANTVLRSNFKDEQAMCSAETLEDHLTVLYSRIVSIQHQIIVRQVQKKRGLSVSEDNVSVIDKSGLQLYPSRSWSHPRLSNGGILDAPRRNWYTLPSAEDLHSIEPDKDGNCWVDELLIGRHGYGRILFPGRTNLSGVNLANDVSITRGQLALYPGSGHLPPRGQGLNRPAQVTLDKVWPRHCHWTGRRLDLSNAELEEDFVHELEQVTRSIGARFVEYISESGSWIFTVRSAGVYRFPADSKFTCSEDDACCGGSSIDYNQFSEAPLGCVFEE